jgi:hypothetical protein
MEKGFFHPDHGYWQTTNEPPQEVIDAYPAGTVEVPLRPGDHYKYDGNSWVPPTQGELDDLARALLEAQRSGMWLSFAQLMIGLVAEQWITEEEGRLWLTGTLPPQVVSTINLIPEEQRFAATAKATRPSVVERMDPLVQRMALVQKRSDAEVDDFFRTYASA